MAYGKVSMFEENSLVTCYVKKIYRLFDKDFSFPRGKGKLYVLLLPLNCECYHCQDGHIGNQLRGHNSHIASHFPKRYWVVTPK